LGGDRDLIGKNVKVDVYRKVETTDTGWNVPEASWPDTATYTDMRARISTLRPDQKETLKVLGDTISTVAAHGLYLDADDDVRIGDHIKHDGKVYEVVSLDNVDKEDIHQEGIIVLWEGVVT